MQRICAYECICTVIYYTYIMHICTYVRVHTILYMYTYIGIPTCAHSWLTSLNVLDMYLWYSAPNQMWTLGGHTNCSHCHQLWKPQDAKRPLRTTEKTKQFQIPSKQTMYIHVEYKYAHTNDTWMRYICSIHPALASTSMFINGVIEMYGSTEIFLIDPREWR